MGGSCLGMGAHARPPGGTGPGSTTLQLSTPDLFNIQLANDTPDREHPLLPKICPLGGWVGFRQGFFSHARHLVGPGHPCRTHPCSNCQVYEIDQGWGPSHTGKFADSVMSHIQLQHQAKTVHSRKGKASETCSETTAGTLWTARARLLNLPVVQSRCFHNAFVFPSHHAVIC